MTSSTPRTMRARGAARPQLRCPCGLWLQVVSELRRRGGDRSESGAFLLGEIEAGQRSVARVVYYDDLDPDCLSTGAVVLHGPAFGSLWARCRAAGLAVVADVHTHPFGARQSQVDRVNPMVAQAGHLALIIPDFARGTAVPETLGIYEYLGSHQWRDHSGPGAADVFTLDEEET